mmetsp:Transcript_26749/g.62834  ORF Transcript_26749/g.62834 Transcript_26749/m.62834 type:complete len:90 (+) Transcript_26749:1292-1561(+)
MDPDVREPRSGRLARSLQIRSGDLRNENRGCEIIDRHRSGNANEMLRSYVGKEDMGHPKKTETLNTTNAAAELLSSQGLTRNKTSHRRD